MEEIDKNIFFTSDLHTYHTNLCYGVSKWENKEDGTRKFDTIEEMNHKIFTEINETVGKDDILYICGDFSFGGITNIWNTRKNINCKNVHLILGNHDHHIKKNKEIPNCYRENDTNHIIDEEYNPTFLKVYARELFTSVNNEKVLLINGQKIILSHYPLETWEDIENGSWNLFGHFHGNFEESNKLQIDVGLDARNLKVLSFNDVFEIMKIKKFENENK